MAMIDGGMNICRLNMAHNTLEVGEPLQSLSLSLVICNGLWQQLPLYLLQCFDGEFAKYFIVIGFLLVFI